METINGVGHVTSYTYDEDNRVTAVINRGIRKQYIYDSFGRIIRKPTSNGITDNYNYTATDTGLSSQIATHYISAGSFSWGASYTYDDNGNITSISDGTNATSYVYDSANQLIRENNQAANYTYTWAYDNAGNILNRKEYAYTTGEPGTFDYAFTYTYGDSQWGDLLTGRGGVTVTSDAIGNTLSDGMRTYTWEHGRELATLTRGNTTWTYTYNADGLRTKRTNGTITYSYVYNGSQLTQMTKGADTLYFAYDANGTPLTVTYNGTTYYYVTNLQGDVVAILNSAGTAVATYSYDAWGGLLLMGGSMEATLGELNPLRYRSYIFDSETGLYYLQSRYYDPGIGRFINADGQISGVGGDLLGYNQFAYCFNNPVNLSDSTGNWPIWIRGGAGTLVTAVVKAVKNMVSTVVASVITLVANNTQSSSHNTNRRPNTGEPGSTYVAPNGDTRTYGQDGTPQHDYDHDDHGQPSKHPHDEKGGHNHDWNNGVRGPAYSVQLEPIAGAALVTTSIVGIAFVAADDVIGVGIVDDFLFAPLGASLSQGLILIFG